MKEIHGGFTVAMNFLENRRPSPTEPAAERFYDEEGRLVDGNHAYAGCRGTPNQYPAEDWLS